MGDVTGLFNGNAGSTINRMGVHSDNSSKAIAQLASGKRINAAKDDSSGAAIAAQMGSNISVLSQTKINAGNAASLLGVATGALGNQKDLLISMKTLATAAADASLSTNSRAMIDNEFQQLLAQVGDVASRARWNGVSLMTGGAGTVTNSGAVVAAAVGVIASAGGNGVDAGATALTGFVSGSASAVDVSKASATGYDVSIKIGEQWFKAENVVPSNAGTFKLTSTIDSGSSFTLTFDAAVTDITSVSTFKTALEQSMGTGGASVNANFLAVSAAPANGLTSFTAASNVAAGTYAFRYDAGSSTLSLTDGKQKWTETVTAPGAAQSVAFSNGITVNLDNTFALGTSIAQTVFDVAQGSAVSLSFQVAEKATDTLTVNIAGTSLASLGLSGLSVADIANANVSSVAIENALNVVNSAYSQLGAQQKRLDSVQSNLDTTIEGLKGAKSNIEDADVAQAMTDYTIANTMAQVSSVALSQSLQMTQQLLSIVRS